MVRDCQQRLRDGVVAVLLVTSVGEQVQAQIAYDSPRGRVEVLGLRRWTLEALHDSVRARGRGLALHDAACMVVLRDSLRFADALVSETMYQPADGGAPVTYVLIKVVEPSDSARVRWDLAPRDTFKVVRPSYAHVVLPVTDSAGNFWRGRIMWPLQFYRAQATRRATVRQVAPRLREQALADGERLWRFLASRRSAVDQLTARRVLRGDGFYVNRLVAAAVLANFPEQDSTWWALMAALRDPNEAVREAAAAVLGQLPPRRVDWAPAAPGLRLLLGGTNVGATQLVLQLLVRTGISPDLAGPLLRGNGDWVLEHLRAEFPGDRFAARAFLSRLNGGRDLGSPEAWSAWVARL